MTAREPASTQEFAEATPRPWIHEGCEIYGGSGTDRARVVAILAEGHVIPAKALGLGSDEWDVAMADAALIVAAVNSYGEREALVEALRDIMTELENNGAPTPGDRSRMAQAAREALRAAGAA